MSKHLVIVESPAKAKTIEKYLGKNFRVLSSYGHVRDLAKGNKAIDVKNGFKPNYIVSEDKQSVIKNLKKATQGVSKVWLATDADREGEAISWHLKEVLGLKDQTTARIVFREITKTAISKAVANPRSIDYNLVNAQQARRVLDRLVGFELSPVLWKKIQRGLSAGRVQSIALKLIVEREMLILAFKPEVFFKTTADFKLADGKTNLQAQLREKFKTESDSLGFVQACQKASFSVEDLTKTPAKRSPAAPFITSSLQQEASSKCGFSVTQTMVLAQKLYEAGHITYMRTDSVNLSNEALRMAAEVIEAEFGIDYVQTRHFGNKTKNAQEAHEAIRPTNFKCLVPADMESRAQRLYTLIRQRTLASQMKDAILEKTTIKIKITGRTEKFIAQGQLIKFDGFLRLYRSGQDNQSNQEKLLPPLQVGEVLNLVQLVSREQFTSSKGRYNEANLVKQLESLGIGRPSTYAPIISTIQKRNYVNKGHVEGKTRSYRCITLKENQITQATKEELFGAEKNKLLPTDIGKVVCKFLDEYFPNIMDYSFTAKAEKELDKIATGELVWNAMLQTFYTSFHDQVLKIADEVDRSEVNISRELGLHPKTKAKVIARLGAYGPLVQMGEGEQAVYASLLKNQSLETITLAEALKLLALPRKVGIYNNHEIIAARGRFGPYLKYKDKFYSLKNTSFEALTITLSQAQSLIEAKDQADRQNNLKFFESEGIKVINGRYGIYFTYKGKNHKLPKDINIETLTAAECISLANNKKGRWSNPKK